MNESDAFHVIKPTLSLAGGLNAFQNEGFVEKSTWHNGINTSLEFLILSLKLKVSWDINFLIEKSVIYWEVYELIFGIFSVTIKVVKKHIRGYTQP